MIQNHETMLLSSEDSFSCIEKIRWRFGVVVRILGFVKLFDL